MAVLPSQRLKFQRYREKHDPLPLDLVIFVGLLLVALSFATNESDVRNLRSSETAYISTIFLLSFLGSLFRHVSPKIIGLLIATVSFVGFVNIVSSTLSIASFHVVSQDRELCEMFLATQTCFEYRLIPPTTPTLVDYLVITIAATYAAFACYVNLRSGVFDSDSHT